METSKAVMRPAMEYASSICSPVASSTSINKLKVMHNAALRTSTGCTQDTNIQDSRCKIQYAFIRQEHNIIYTHMIKNNIRLDTSTKEQKRSVIIDATLIFMSVDFRHGGYVNFTRIRAKLNLGKSKFFESNKE